MSTYFGVTTHRIIYKAAGFAVGKTVTAYIWNPTLLKSALKTFIEVSDGLYYLDYTFAVEGTHFGVFYEDAVPTVSGVFRIVDIFTSVWDEPIAAHLDVGSTGLALNSAGAAGDPWSATIPGFYGAGTAGKILGDNINAPIGTVDTVVDSIKTAMDDIHDTDLPAVKGDTAAIKAQTDIFNFDTDDNVLAQLNYPTGAVVADGDNEENFFKTDLTSAVEEFWVGGWVKFTSGALANQPPKKIIHYDAALKFLTTSAFTSTPAGADTFIIVNQ